MSGSTREGTVFLLFFEPDKWQLLSQNQSSDIWCLELIDFGRFGVILGDF